MSKFNGEDGGPLREKARELVDYMTTQDVGFSLFKRRIDVAEAALTATWNEAVEACAVEVGIRHNILPTQAIRKLKIEEIQ